MDQTAQPINKQSSLIPVEQAEALFTELHLQNLPADKKEEMLNTMIDTVMDRIFLRIEPALSPEVKQKLDELESQPDADAQIAQLLTSSVPNVDRVAQEEINRYREDLKLQVNTIIKTFDEEALKQGENVVQPATNPFEGISAQPAPIAVPQTPPVVAQVSQLNSWEASAIPVGDPNQMAEALGAPSGSVQTPGDTIIQPTPTQTA